jgi:hypothetical protein
MIALQKILCTVMLIRFIRICNTNNMKTIVTLRKIKINEILGVHTIK